MSEELKTTEELAAEAETSAAETPETTETAAPEEPAETMADYAEELEASFKQIHEGDILTGTMDAFASIISNNVNTIMKRMTSLSITLMIPTLIASFYGMNVDIHLEEMPYAFALIILCSVVLSTLAFIVFRKIKWF